MLFDSIIIGGGPAGLNAALVLRRARRNFILFDNNKPVMRLHMHLMDLLQEME